MGKQATANAQRVALANALQKDGAPPKAPPPQKEPPKPAPKDTSSRPRRKDKEPEPPPKTKKDIEEEQRRIFEEQEQKRAAFYVAEAARKAEERRPIDESVTYIEDKNTRKPVAVKDISQHWVSKMVFLPYLPSDNVGPIEVPADIDVNERIKYLHVLNSQLEELLRMRFHVFWSQVLFDQSVLRAIDSYLRFSLRSYDIASIPEVPEDELGPLIVEERQVSEQIGRRVLAVLRRLSRREESPSDYLSAAKFAEFIETHAIFDVPKLIDLCTIYGDNNREAITKLVHALFQDAPHLLAEFKSIIQHMLGSLLECCRPLSAASDPGESLSLDDCLAFLPDVLSSFNAVFCFFPEECVDVLLSSSLELPGMQVKDDSGVPLSDLMVVLYSALDRVDEKSVESGRAKLLVRPQVRTIRALLCKFLSCVLGFHMAPRKGAEAYEELLEWCRARVEKQPELLLDLGRNGLENVAVEWLASGLIDEARLDFLEELCGQLLPPEVRRRRRPRNAEAKAAAAAAAGGGSSSSTSGGKARDSSSDGAKIKEVREVVGKAYGDGFILQCLLHYNGSVPAVLENILEATLPPQLATLPQGLRIGEDPNAASGADKAAPSTQDKAFVMQQMERMQNAAAALAAEADEYDDDYDDALDVQERFNVGTNRSDSEATESDGGPGARGANDDEESSDDNGKGGKNGSKGKGKGKGRSRGPVQGQTYAARKKEENKGRVANHNRRQGALWKMSRGM